MTGLIEQAGGQPQKQPKYVPVHEDRLFTGLNTQRAILHDPSDPYTARYLGGRPDALLMGKNIELTNRLTLQRRPGLVPFRNIGSGSGAIYPLAPNRAYSFQLSNGTIQVIIDTASSGQLSVTNCSNASGGVTYYYGDFPNAANNGYVGLTFNVTGFDQGENNGTFTCTASTGGTITLNNPNGVADTPSTVAEIETSGGIYLDNQNGTITLLYAKSFGAGQAYFQAVAGVLYFGDGIDVKKYTPLNSNGTIWNWGTAAPTVQPTITITQSGAASTTWQKSTVFSTMGLTLDSTNNQIWQVVAVNNPNAPQFGTTGTGQPAWNTALWGQTSDGGVTWINAGLIADWQPNTFYTDTGTNPTNHAAPGVIGVVSVTGLYVNQKNSGNLGKTEGANTEPKFTGNWPGASYFEANNSGNNGLNWFPVFNWGGSSGSTPMLWKQSHAYPAWYTGSPTGSAQQISGTVTACITGTLPSTAANPVYLMIPIAGGTSGSGYAPWQANWANLPVTDNELTWLCLGPSGWQADANYTPWTGQGQGFGCIYDGTNFQVCTASTGPTGGTVPASWGTTYGTPTVDGGVTWVCVGPSVTWASGQVWNFPSGGFAPPEGSQKYGGSTIVAGTAPNEYVVAVTSSGTSNNSAEPTFPAPPGTQTDGTITWQSIGDATTNSLSWSYGLAYSYSYKARPLDDEYSPTSTGGGGLFPPGTTAAQQAPFKVAPTGSETNVISTASPVYQITGPNSGAVVTVQGVYSSDPQIDTIVIFRSADTASGSDNMYELTEIPNFPNLGGQTWTFQDYLPSVASGIYPGLNVLLPAPIDDQNNPPPSTFLPQVYNFQRIWGSNGQSVPFSGGPDVDTGNPNEAFNPSDELPFLAPVVRLVRTPQGTVTFLTDSIEMIQGGPATATFFSTTMAPGIGLLSYNACDVYAGEIYFFSADNQFKTITPSLNVSSYGFAIGDLLANQPTTGVADATWDPTKVYVTVHMNGTDSCIFIADGSTGWYRLNPHQIPGNMQGPEPIWSPFAEITNGCQMVQSVETSPGIAQLLVGPTAAGGQILVRDLQVFSDNGLSYNANFTMGSITLAKPGQRALLKFLEADLSGQEFEPTVSYLLNEISGTFTDFVNAKGSTPVFDPPSLYGETIIPSSYSPNRYYFSSNADLAQCRHMQIKFDFGGGSTTYTAIIEDVSISLTGVLTLTVNQTVGFAVGQTMYLDGLTSASFLNGQRLLITGVTADTLTAQWTSTPGEYVQTVDGTGSTTLTIDNTLGDLMVAFVKIGGSGGAHAATINDTLGNTWNLIGVAVDGGNIPSAMYYAYNIQGGENTLTLSLPAGFSDVYGFYVMEFTGIPGNSNPFDQGAVHAWTYGGSTPSITTGVPNALLVGATIQGPYLTDLVAAPPWIGRFTDDAAMLESYGPVPLGTLGFPDTYNTAGEVWGGVASFATLLTGTTETGTAKVQVSQGSVNGDEIYSLTLFGRVIVE